HGAAAPLSRRRPRLLPADLRLWHSQAGPAWPRAALLRWRRARSQARQSERRELTGLHHLLEAAEVVHYLPLGILASKLGHRRAEPSGRWRIAQDDPDLGAVLHGGEVDQSRVVDLGTGQRAPGD